MDNQFEACRGHGERLAAIEATLKAIDTKLSREEGSIAETVQRLWRVETRCAAHDSFTVQETKFRDDIGERVGTLENRCSAYDEAAESLQRYRAKTDARLDTIVEECSSMKLDISVLKSSSRTALAFGREILGIIVILLLAWQAWTAQKALEHTHAPAATASGR